MTNNIAPEAPAKHPPDPSAIDIRLYRAVKEAIASPPIQIRLDVFRTGRGGFVSKSMPAT